MHYTSIHYTCQDCCILIVRGKVMNMKRRDKHLLS